MKFILCLLALCLVRNACQEESALTSSDDSNICGPSCIEDIEKGWIDIGEISGVQTFKKIFGTKLLAVKGVATVPLHISAILAPFLNATANPLW